MKASSLVISLIGVSVLLGAASTVTAQDSDRSGVPCGTTAVAYTEASDHDSVYDPLNGITNEAPVDKASRLGWKKRTSGNGTVAYAEPVAAEHDSVYDSLNGITNEAPVDKASRLAWKKRAASGAKEDCK